MKEKTGPTEEAFPHRSGAFPWQAYLSMTAATFFWSSNVVAVKFAVLELPQMATAALRITLAAAVLVLTYALGGGRFHLRQGERRSFLKLSLFGLSLSFLFFTMGVNYSSVSHAVFIGASGPIAILLWARAYGLERITPRKLAGLLLSLGGVLALALDRSGGPGPGWQGDFLVAAAVSCFAFYTVRIKKIASHYASLQFNAFSFLAAAVWVSPLLVWELARLPWERISWVGWSGLFYSATLGSAGAYLAYYYSLRLISASRAAAFHYLQPVLGTVLGVLFFQESLTTQFGIGAALILTGLFVAQHG